MGGPTGSVVSAETLRDEIVNILLESEGPVSGEEISRRLGVSRAAIWKHIKALRAEGYEIQSSTKVGYTLARLTDLLLPREITRGLSTRQIGRRVYHFDETPSTNDVAKNLARSGAPHGTVVVAERQTGGRGRLGRAWQSPEGGIWMSIVLRPKIEPRMAAGLTLALGYAVARAVSLACGLSAKLKWPNDVFIHGKKAVGVLTEISAEMDSVNYVVAGIGINANVDVSGYEFTATSLSAELGRRIDRAALARAVLKEVEDAHEVFVSKGLVAMISDITRMSCTVGSRVEVKTPEGVRSGLAVGIDEDGALLVKEDGGEVRRFLSGDVTIGSSQNLHQ